MNQIYMFLIDKLDYSIMFISYTDLHILRYGTDPA